MKKICTICDIEKPVTDFYVRKDTGKLRSECKVCIGIRNVQLLCPGCNFRKASTDPYEYAQQLGKLFL